MGDVVPAGEVPSAGRLVEALRADSSSVASLTRVLASTLATTLPPEMIEVEVKRSLADRMAGRDGVPVGITLRLGETTLTLRGEGARAQAEIAREVRGVIISRRQVSIVEWIQVLADEITARAASDSAARTALERMLLG